MIFLSWIKKINSSELSQTNKFLINILPYCLQKKMIFAYFFFKFGLSKKGIKNSYKFEISKQRQKIVESRLAIEYS